jgi:hypothetical protein
MKAAARVAAVAVVVVAVVVVKAHVNVMAQFNQLHS